MVLLRYFSPVGVVFNSLAQNQCRGTGAASITQLVTLAPQLVVPRHDVCLQVRATLQRKLQQRYPAQTARPELGARSGIVCKLLHYCQVSPLLADIQCWRQIDLIT